MPVTTNYILKGKCSFFKLLGKGDEEFRAWTVRLYLDKESQAVFLKLKEGGETYDGILNEMKQDDDGYYVSLRRPFSKKFKGAETLLSPPVVLDQHNLPWQDNRLVGNGSDISVKVSHYTFKPPFTQRRGSAIRLESARIDNLVPYEMDRDFDEFQHKAVKGLIDQPRVPFD